MKRKLLVIFLIVLCSISVGIGVCASGIDSQANMDGSVVTITGKLNGVNHPKIVTLLVGDADNIAYIDEVTSDSVGNFAFTFAFDKRGRTFFVNFSSLFKTA